jgi:hypothetical protein
LLCKEKEVIRKRRKPSLSPCEAAKQSLQSKKLEGDLLLLLTTLEQEVKLLLKEKQESYFLANGVSKSKACFL